MSKDKTVSLDAQIAELEAQIVKLTAERDALKAQNVVPYPKHIQVPIVPEDTHPTQTVVVNSEEEEKAVLAKHKPEHKKEPK